MDPNDQKKTACYDIDVEVEDPLKTQMSGFLLSTANQQEIALLDNKVSSLSLVLLKQANKVSSLSLVLLRQANKVRSLSVVLLRQAKAIQPSTGFNEIT